MTGVKVMHQSAIEAPATRHEEFKVFVSANVAPFAEEWDRAQRIPEAVISSLARRGYLGCSVPTEYGGQGWNITTFGQLNEALGRGSPALTGVLTVQSMVAMTLLKWGTNAQKRTWLPPLAEGTAIGAFALTEPTTGSDLESLRTEFVPLSSAREEFVLNGFKKWISCAQFADVFLVFGLCERRSAAALVPRRPPGVRVEPIDDLMAFRGAGLAEVHFDNVKVPLANMVGRPGFALSHVAPVGLHYGRISTACSALGLLRGCVEESVTYASSRRIGRKAVADLGMIRTLIARMGTDLQAARLLCEDACRAEDDHTPEAYQKALIAKYFTSTAVVRAASAAVQIHGAAGVHASSPVSRYYRDAKIMEIIEGTTQIHEDLLGQIFAQGKRGDA
jgi:alkylation response protein AidB-like acyl-CoA dehydrogenase